MLISIPSMKRSCKNAISGCCVAAGIIHSRLENCQSSSSVSQYVSMSVSMSVRNITWMRRDPTVLRGLIMFEIGINRATMYTDYFITFLTSQYITIHSHKILTIQQGKPCYVSILSNPSKDQETSQAGRASPVYNMYTHWYILWPNSLS